MLTEIITLYPDSTPPTEPPSAARYRVQRERELLNADMHAAARLRYGNRLPIVLPYWYTENDIEDRVHAYNRTPAFIGTVGARISAFRKRTTGNTELRMTA